MSSSEPDNPRPECITTVHSYVHEILALHLGETSPQPTSLQNVLIFSSKTSTTLRFAAYHSAYTSHFIVRAACPTHLTVRDFIITITFYEVYILRRSSLCIFLHPPVTSFLNPNIFLSTLYSERPWIYELLWTPSVTIGKTASLNNIKEINIVVRKRNWSEWWNFP